MNRRLVTSLLCVSALGGQLLHAQAPAPEGAANTATQASPDALSQLRARIAEQQEEIKKLQQAVDDQQKMLQQAISASSTTAAPAAAPATKDGTPIVATANSAGPVKLVPAVDTPKPDIVNMPRYMQKDESKVSPLSVGIGDATFTPFGFIDFIVDGRSTNTGNGLGTGFAGIPYNNSYLAHIAEQNISMQNTRLGFRIDSTVLGAKVLGYFEMDFLGNQPGSIFQTSNSSTFRMRNIFIDVRKNKLEMEAGQDWTMFAVGRKGLSPIPSDVFYSQAVDTNYLAALVWARQGQFRLIAHPNDNFAIGVSLENPQQYIGGGVTLPTAYSTQLATQLNNGSTNYTAPSVHPDIIAKAAYDNKVLHLEAGGLIRTFKIDTSSGTPVVYTTHSATAATGEVNGIVNLNKRFRLIMSTFFGEGGGRYIGGTGPDLIVRANGSISPVHSYATTDGFEFNPTKNTLLYSYYSASEFKKDSALDSNGKLIGYGFAGSSLSDNKAIQEITFGFSPTFWKNSNYGALGMNLQYSYLMRDPWNIPAAGPKEAHTNIYYIDLRYTIP